MYKLFDAICLLNPMPIPTLSPSPSVPTLFQDSVYWRLSALYLLAHKQTQFAFIECKYLFNILQFNLQPFAFTSTVPERSQSDSLCLNGISVYSVLFQFVWPLPASLRTYFIYTFFPNEQHNLMNFFIYLKA